MPTLYFADDCDVCLLYSFAFKCNHCFIVIKLNSSIRTGCHASKLGIMCSFFRVDSHYSNFHIFSHFERCVGQTTRCTWAVSLFVCNSIHQIRCSVPKLSFPIQSIWVLLIRVLFHAFHFYYTYNNIELNTISVSIFTSPWWLYFGVHLCAWCWLLQLLL